MQIVPFDHHFQIPENIALCPYCGQKMHASVNAWEQEDEEKNLWIATAVETTCESEPEDFESDEYGNWVKEHSEMPYVYLLPVNSANNRYCFNQCE